MAMKEERPIGRERRVVQRCGGEDVYIGVSERGRGLGVGPLPRFLIPS